MFFQLVGPAWSRVFRPLWVLEETGLPYRLLDQVLPMSKEARHYTKSGKVPVLLQFPSAEAAQEPNATPDVMLTESLAISTYLGSLAGTESPALVPQDVVLRAKYDQTTCAILSELDAHGLWIHRKHTAMSHVFGDIPDAAKAAEKNFHRMNKQIAAPLQQSAYLLGDDLSVADIVYVHCLDWAKSIGWHNHDDGSPAWSDALHAYRRRCHERPAYQRAQALRKATLPPAHFRERGRENSSKL